MKMITSKKVVAQAGLHSITVYEDGGIVWKNYYDTALEAAQDFVKFTDHGMADWERVIILETPEGSKRMKRYSRIEVIK